VVSRSWAVNLPAEKVYKALINYFRAGVLKTVNKREKIKRSSEPSYIEVETISSRTLRIKITPSGPDRCIVLADIDTSMDTAVAIGLFLFSVILVIISGDARVLAFTMGPIWGIIIAASRQTDPYMNKISEFLKIFESTGVVPEFKVEEKPRPELPPETLHLYQRLIDRYSRIYGRSRYALEYRIEEYMWKGLSREEAIKRLAKKEGILEGAEREHILEMTKGDLPPDILHLYQRLVDRYCSVYGRSRYALEHKIEEYMWEGLSREEAIKRLAWEEGIRSREKG